MIIFHIGLHKTGSSSIQAALHQNAQRLAGFGVDYPALEDARGRSHLALVERRHGPRDPKVEQHWQRLLAAYDAAPQRQLVLSAEGFSQMGVEELGPLARRLQGRPVRILAYVRPLASQLPSWYFQLTRQGQNVLDFDAYLADGLANGTRFRPYERIRGWGEVFGWDTVRVRSVDSGALHQGSLIPDVLHAIGLDDAQITALDRLDLRRNSTREGWQLIEVLRATMSGLEIRGKSGKGRRTPEQRELASRSVQLIVSACKDLGWPELPAGYLTAAQATALHQLYLEQVELLARHAGSARISRPEAAAASERPFLPTLAAVEPELLKPLLRRLKHEPDAAQLFKLLQAASGRDQQRAADRDERRRQQTTLRKRRRQPQPGQI